MGNDCWYFRARYAGMTKVCMTQSIVECGRIRRFGLCGFPPDSEEWRQCGFAIGQHQIPLMVEKQEGGLMEDAKELLEKIDRALMHAQDLLADSLDHHGERDHVKIQEDILAAICAHAALETRLVEV